MKYKHDKMRRKVLRKNYLSERQPYAKLYKFKTSEDYIIFLANKYLEYSYPTTKMFIQVYMKNCYLHIVADENLGHQVKREMITSSAIPKIFTQDVIVESI